MEKHFLIIILFYFSSMTSTIGYAQGYSEDKPITIGFRTGISYINMPYYSNNSNGKGRYYYIDVGPQRKFYNHVFINKKIGKKKRSMLELQTGMNRHGEYSSGSNSHIEYVEWNRRLTETVLTPAIIYRYRFLHDKSNYWQHYVGVIYSPHIVVDRIVANYSYPHRNEYRTDIKYDVFRQTHWGVEYYGMVQGKNRWSLQYSMAYTFHNPFLQMYYTRGERSKPSPFQHRFNANIGIGYRL